MKGRIAILNPIWHTVDVIFRINISSKENFFKIYINLLPMVK